MGIRFYKEPKLTKPDLIASWPGIGNIGILAVDTLRGMVKAKELGEIEPWQFFDPKKVSIKAGLLEELEFPTSKFYFQRVNNRDLLFFIGDQQPSEHEGFYARGEKAHRMANLVVDVGLKFGCQRVYTSGACVSLIHHETKPRVCAAVSSEELVSEVRQYPNTILMSEMEGREGTGIITGLNGLLLAVAKKRGLEGICLMGEIPDWLSRAPFSYPKASKSVLEVFADILGIGIDLGVIDKMAASTEEIIEKIYEKFPTEIKERYDQRKLTPQARQEAITDEDARWITEHMEEFFKGKGKKDGEGAI